MAEQSRFKRSVGFSRILGRWETTALGLSLTFSLGTFVLGHMVGAYAGDDTPLMFLLVGFLYLPIILSYAELGATVRGSASPYRLALGQGSNWRTFAVGWLMLGGLACVGALLTEALALRLVLGVDQLFGVQFERLWVMVVVVAGIGLNEWLSIDDRWRARTVFIWLLVTGMVGVLIRFLVFNPPSPDAVARVGLEGHDLAIVGVLGASLWGIDLILNHRRQLKDADKTMRWSMLAVWIVTHAFAVIASIVVARSADLEFENWIRRLAWHGARTEMFVLVAGLSFCWLGLSRIVARATRLASAMADKGFLPIFLQSEHENRGGVQAFLLLLMGLIVLIAWTPQSEIEAGIAALSFLVVTILVMLPWARRPAHELAEDRANRLPLHPLFPSLAIAICGFLALILPRVAFPGGLIWVLLGVGLYFGYARRRGLVAKQPRAVVGTAPTRPEKRAYRMLACLPKGKSAESLLGLAVSLAEAKEGEVLALRVVPHGDDLSLYHARAEASSEWTLLKEWAEKHVPESANVQPLVRIAPTVDSGILATMAEYDVDFVLLGAPAALKSWSLEEALRWTEQHSSVGNRVFTSTARPVAILQGELPQGELSIVVGTCGGPHAPFALELAKELTAVENLELVAVVPRGNAEKELAEALASTVERAELERPVQTRLLEADSVVGGLVETSGDRDLLMIGASVDRLLKQTIFGGLPIDVAVARSKATLVVKRAERVVRYWQRRLWEFVSRPLPTLSAPERAQVLDQMRHSAKADVDFYALISISAAIAILGLLLDSSAVIIGAMLVAPLMSPILAIAQGVVQGNLYLIQRAGASTLKGSVVAIAVATVVSLMLGSTQATHEILARTEPNLLDLGVALAAGAAAAYAVSRASVAAALPGVAISVALVPPLCVVGYGLGTSQFHIAGGALLLFLTNLAGIVLVGGIIFLLLGFRPTRAERDVNVRRAAMMAMLGVLLLALPLGLTTFRVRVENRLERKIDQMLQEYVNLRFQDYRVEKIGGKVVVEGIIYTTVDVSPEDLEAWRREVSEAMGVPISLRTTLVPANFIELDAPESEEADLLDAIEELILE